MTQLNENGKRTKLDIKDMERRLVEFRLTLDREKRRFQLAQMTDSYEKLLRDKLVEVRRQQSSRGQTQDTTQCGDGTHNHDNHSQQRQQPGQQANDSTTNPDNEIKLTCVDREGSARLRNFLAYTIEMCKRVDQQELMQEVLRGALLDTRRKRFKTQQEVPNVVLEPFCLFCAADLKAVTLASECHNQHHRNLTPPPALTNVHSTSLPRVALVHQETPPPSAVATPDVGEQSRIYTPNAGARDTPSTPSPDLGVMNKLIKTNASSTKAALGQVVLPSDEDGSSSEDNNPASLRTVMEWANRSKSPLNKVVLSQGGGSDGNETDATSDERRCSTPLGDNPERTLPNLVIADTDQRACSSPIPRLSSSKSIKGGNSVNTTFTAPAEVKPNLRQRAGDTSTRSMDTTSASRLEESSQQQQQQTSVKGGGTIKKKFKPRRRNKNN